MDNNQHYSSHLNFTERTRKLHEEKNEPINNEHYFQSYSELDNDYNNLVNQKNKKKKSSIINLTSEVLKEEYKIKSNYWKKGVSFLLFFSILAVINSLIENKYLKSNEFNSIILLMAFFSAGLCFVLIVNIKANAIIDSYGYAAFYFLAILQTILFFLLFILKIFKFIFDFMELYQRNSSKKDCAILIIFNSIIIIGSIYCLKFIFCFFLEAINILTKRRKTLFERQLELNLIEKNENRKLEFDEDKKLNSNKENSKDNMKIE